MECQILNKDIDINTDPRIEPIHTIDELDELIEELGSGVQIKRRVGGNGWVIDNFRKPSKEKCCGNCDWWEAEKGSLDIEGSLSGYGCCTRALGPQDNRNNYRPGPDTRESPMILEDGETYKATLYTKSEHDCSAWEAEGTVAKPEEKQEPFVSMIGRSKEQITKDKGKVK